MTFDELQKEVGKYVYSEDNGMARIALASILAHKMKMGTPVWMLLIGASSGGKSQILRPLALADKKFMHRVDDLTENTLLSGARVKADKKGNASSSPSLLVRIGAVGMIVISDLTVIFSKSSETKNAILSQFRMVYDGDMKKETGIGDNQIRWEGHIGVIAGSTPTVYRHFEEVADMGERFIFYRMKPYDKDKATRLSLAREITGKKLDALLGDMYGEYLTACSEKMTDIPKLSDAVMERIISASSFAEKVRTPAHYNQYIRAVDRIPESALPMRTAQQLKNIAKGLSLMNYTDTGKWDLSERDIRDVEWCAYSLANEERRACLRILAGEEYGKKITAQTIADKIGLDTLITGINLQHLTALKVLQRTGENNQLSFTLVSEQDRDMIRRMEGITDIMEVEDRELSTEELLQGGEVEMEF